ncbi:4-oxalomesaconate tautomerase [Acinetobacter sp. ME22]|uniref:4-oxalomesaconate tautomerase n=1 Tax=Acinetobacter sp. ME22 TaxID=2904802 RepID=UPI001EDB11DC|nr:4-oxalomesaconate tautomerase [Acinetobacter sp. ME22]MCG2573392.1 4-oxalomesaconate tautomerase [Acinetobacter sp. ME22]
MQTKIRCMLMRGGTSKAAYFLASDLPQDPALRDQVLLAVMGSPDARQINGIGGGDSLTSKVAIVSQSSRTDADVDYLFAQVNVEKAVVDYGQNCGNILSGVAPFAVERGLIAAQADSTTVRIFMQNTEQLAKVTIQTPNAEVNYVGDTYIDGVPQPSAEVILNFQNIEGSTCGSLLPTGNVKDTIYGVSVTCIDNGMPVVLINAADLGIIGTESPQQLDSNIKLKQQIEAIRLVAGQKMNLGDVSNKTVPKMSIVSPAIRGGAIHTRTFIPHKCHAAIGVFGATSVATACLIEGTVAFDVAQTSNDLKQRLNVEHPTGRFTVLLERNEQQQITGCGFIRTARALFDGFVMIPQQLWDNRQTQKVSQIHHDSVAV